MSNPIAHTKALTHRVILRWCKVGAGSLGSASAARFTCSGPRPGSRSTRFPKARRTITGGWFVFVIALTGAALHAIDAALAVESDNRMCADLFALSAVGVDIIARAGLFDYSERIGHSNHRAQSNLHDPIASNSLTETQWKAPTGLVWSAATCRRF